MREWFRIDHYVLVEITIILLAMSVILSMLTDKYLWNRVKKLESRIEILEKAIEPKEGDAE